MKNKGKKTSAKGIRKELTAQFEAELQKLAITLNYNPKDAKKEIKKASLILSKKLSRTKKAAIVETPSTADDTKPVAAVPSKKKAKKIKDGSLAQSAVLDESKIQSTD